MDSTTETMQDSTDWIFQNIMTHYHRVLPPLPPTLLFYSFSVFVKNAIHLCLAYQFTQCSLCQAPWKHTLQPEYILPLINFITSIYWFVPLYKDSQFYSSKVVVMGRWIFYIKLDFVNRLFARQVLQVR